jgi:hypothetical protein
MLLPQPAGRGGSCLSRRAGEGEQARVLAGEEREHLGELALPAQKGGRGDGQVGAVEAPECRKVGVFELEDPLGSRQILEPVLAEICELELDELSR